MGKPDFLYKLFFLCYTTPIITRKGENKLTEEQKGGVLVNNKPTNIIQIGGM